MKEKLTIEEKKKQFEAFLEKHQLRVTFYKHLLKDKVDFFIETPEMHWLVMAFNWALVPCLDMRENKSKPRKSSYEFDWKQIDLKWRIELKALNQR